MYICYICIDMYTSMNMYIYACRYIRSIYHHSLGYLGPVEPNFCGSSGEGGFRLEALLPSAPRGALDSRLAQCRTPANNYLHK